MVGVGEAALTEVGSNLESEEGGEMSGALGLIRMALGCGESASRAPFSLFLLAGFRLQGRRFDVGEEG